MVNRPPSRDPWLERIEWPMDRAIPVGGRSFGLDPILGLIPGAGEAVGAFVSLFLVARAVQLGASKSALARMPLNVAIDSIVTSVPVAGRPPRRTARCTLRTWRARGRPARRHAARALCLDDLEILRVVLVELAQLSPADRKVGPGQGCDSGR
ncbi:MAG TPA: hypothetical protein DEH78_30425 [Solibacterales bacterium]|nr:hypothetical protein [Bryobacterales bacterium]